MHFTETLCLHFKRWSLIAAAEEERFLRIKHWAGFPEESIKWCFKKQELN